MDATDQDGYPLKSFASSLIRGFRSPGAKAFRSVKCHATFAVMMVRSNPCNDKIVVPHDGIILAEKFPAWPHADEFLHCVSHKSQQSPEI
jgi:hypothetical protein